MAAVWQAGKMYTWMTSSRGPIFAWRCRYAPARPFESGAVAMDKLFAHGHPPMAGGASSGNNRGGGGQPYVAHNQDCTCERSGKVE